MRKNHLIDIANITVIAGKGGDGKVSFRREKYIPRGGPDGGDGGRGGSVYLVADENMATLRDFKAKPTYSAQVGERGGSKKMFGADGEDLRIHIPVGTLVYVLDVVDSEGITDDGGKGREVLIGDFIEHGQEIKVATGGLGGKGNDKFKSSTNQTPMQFTRGTPGEVKDLRFEVKLIADVGLVGFPNAGKSTLINRMAGTSAKVASYPFTTLSPNLGIVLLKDGSSAIFADVPGLIEGASEGKGLGDDFLRHIERTRVIVHMVDPFIMEEIPEDKEIGDVIAENSTRLYEAIRKELVGYGGKLEEKKEIVVINKIDIFEVKEAFELIKDRFSKGGTDGVGIEVLGISALTGEGLEELLVAITHLLAKTPKKPIFEVEKPVKIFNINDLPNKRIIYRQEAEIVEKDLK